MVRFGFARWHGFEPSLDVSVHVPVLKPHQVERLPEITQRAHGALLGAAVQQLATAHETAPRVAAITARLDRLEPVQVTEPPSPVVHVVFTGFAVTVEETRPADAVASYGFHQPSSTPYRPCGAWRSTCGRTSTTGCSNW